MQNDKEHLQKLDLLRFPLIVLVVFIHSYHPVLETMSPSGLFVWHFIKDGVASVAIPTFFFISGYLFFYKMEWSIKKWLGKLKSRVFTILIPYIVWTLFYWAFMLLVNHLPEWTLPQFWYLQELVLLCLMAPLFHLLHRRPYLFLTLFAVVWWFFDWHWKFPVLTSMMPILFFYAGSVFAVKKVSLNPPCLGLLDRSKMGDVLRKLSPSVFFVFAFHEPLIKFLITDLNTVYHPATDAGKLALYLVSPVIMLFISVNSYNVLNFVAPGFTAFITGNRNLRSKSC